MAHYAIPHKKCFVQFSTELCSPPIMPIHTKNALFSFSTELCVIVSGQLADTKHQRQNSVASWEAFYCKRWVVTCCWAVYVVSCKFKSTLKTYTSWFFWPKKNENKSFRKKTNLTNHIIPAQCHHQSQQTFCWFTCILVVLLLELYLVAKPQNIWTISKQPISQGLKERAMNGWTSSSVHCTTVS